jgi:hypothetical protein
VPLFCSKLKRAMSNWIKLICREQELETSESSAAETVCLCIDARLDAECHLLLSNWSAFVSGWCLHVYPWWDECVMIKERHFQNGNTITHRHRYFYLSSPCMIVYVLCIVFFFNFLLTVIQIKYTNMRESKQVTVVPRLCGFWGSLWDKIRLLVSVMFASRWRC